jgi:5-methylcytosine-specific restriction protein A
MAVMDELKPTHKARVMDLLGAAGFDLSDWKNYKGKSPAANPKYCYSWSFEQPGEAVAVCLWHKDLRPLNGTVAYHRKANAAVYRRHESPVWNLRNLQFDARLELAFRQQLPVRAIVLDETKRSSSQTHKTKASIVAGRLLDPAPWAVTRTYLKIV